MHDSAVRDNVAANGPEERSDGTPSSVSASGRRSCPGGRPRSPPSGRQDRARLFFQARRRRGGWKPDASATTRPGWMKSWSATWHVHRGDTLLHGRLPIAAIFLQDPARTGRPRNRRLRVSGRTGSSNIPAFISARERPGSTRRSRGRRMFQPDPGSRPAGDYCARRAPPR